MLLTSLAVSASPRESCDAGVAVQLQDRIQSGSGFAVVSVEDLRLCLYLELS